MDNYFFLVLLGSLAGAFVAGKTGAAVGLVCGLLMGMVNKRQATPSQVSLVALQKEVAELRNKVESLTQRIDARSLVQKVESIEILAEKTDLPPMVAEPPAMASPSIPGASDRVSPVIPKPSILLEPERIRSLRRPNRIADGSSGIDARVKNWLFGGNTLVRVGAVVLFFGFGFLVKFVAEHAVVPIEFRYLGLGIGALAALGIGWHLRQRRPAYAMVLQGLGVAVLYLVIFAAFRLHALLPGSLTLLLLVATCLLSAALAVLQDSPTLAVAGVCGGFMAPVLASTGEGSHVVLFSYFLLLDLGILGIAWFKAWRQLNVLGFLFTFGIGTAWGVHRYRDELFATTEPFLLLFFFVYLAITLLYAHRRKQELAPIGALDILGERVDYVDGVLVFGAPLATFGLQYLMVRGMEYGSALSALAFGMVYLPLAMILYRRKRDEFRMLVESFLVLGVVFTTLAIPFALEARWTAAAWAGEGAGIFWVGLHQRRKMARRFALLLQAGAAISLMSSIPFRAAGWVGGWHSSHHALVTGAVFIAAAGIATAWMMHRHADCLDPDEAALEPLILVWGVGWWWLAGIQEIRRYGAGYSLTIRILFAVATALLLLLGGRMVRWQNACKAALLLLPMLILFALFALRAQAHPFALGGWLAWPLAGATLYLVLNRQGDVTPPGYLGVCHTLSLWLVTGLLTWQVEWWFGTLGASGSAWRLLGWALPPLTALTLLNWDRVRHRWPVAAFPKAYRLAAMPVAYGLWAWMLLANYSSNGSAAPLPYLPFVNPLDLASAGVLLALLYWAAPDEASSSNQSLVGGRIPVFLGITAFCWLNGVLLRSLHHWAGIPWTPRILLSSTLVQAALSLFWAVLALILMLWGTRHGLRRIWITGGGLMALVVVKLFVIDLSRVGTVERIVSFIGVGLLLLLLGYFSPVPPRQGGAE